MRRSDLPALQALYDQLHLSDYIRFRVSPAKFMREFERLSESRDHAILVAEREGRVIGTLHVIVVPHLGHGLKPLAIVENVVVASEERSAGIGTRMMEAAGEVARRRGCYKMALTTNVARGRAHLFYERLGWKRTHFGYSLGLR